MQYSYVRGSNGGSIPGLILTHFLSRRWKISLWSLRIIAISTPKDINKVFPTFD